MNRHQYINGLYAFIILFVVIFRIFPSKPQPGIVEADVCYLKVLVIFSLYSRAWVRGSLVFCMREVEQTSLAQFYLPLWRFFKLLAIVLATHGRLYG